MSSAYGTIARPVSDKSLSSVLPRHATLRQHVNGNGAAVANGAAANGEAAAATLFRITSSKDLDSASLVYTLTKAAHPSLIKAMHQVFNEEVQRGDTYPQEFVLDESQFDNYFFSGDSFVLLKGHYRDASDVQARAEAEEWTKDLLGYFYVKPNFPICNGGFIVNPIHRGLGIGGILGKAFLRVVPIIGYRASMFNLVFVSNVASIKLWRRLGFQEIGRIPKAGRLRGQGGQDAPSSDDNEGYVDAIQFYWDFETMAVPAEYDV
ncbi:hypothetical protein BGZ72_006096 [Mortierella alpina]|nr:hypothetical protein BGZ72_006096 [Mortierella alpina]